MITERGIDPRAREFFNYRTKVQRRRTEAEWEEWLIRTLKRLGWKFRKDLQRNEKTRERLLERNLLFQLEKFYGRKHNLPSFQFTPEEKNKLLQELCLPNFKELDEPIVLVTKERRLEIPLIDRNNIDNNCFEVVQQVEEYCRRGFLHIYDLVLLINGLPLVCIELKKATISNNEAFEQLKRYERDRFLTNNFSIFNRFQFFIATNFQRISCFWKSDIKDLEYVDKLSMKLCENGFFIQLNHLDWYFKRSVIIQQLFTKISIRLTRHFAPSPLSFSNIARSKDNASITWDFNIWAEALVWILLISFFLLINCLSGWKWWTILIGLFTLGFGHYKRMQLYKWSDKFLKKFRRVK